MHRVIQKLQLLASLSLIFVAVASVTGGKVFATDLKQNVSCTNGGTKLKFTPNNTTHTLVLTCADGGTIAYITNGSNGNQPVGITISCAGSDMVGDTIKNLNAPNDQITFYCEIPDGRDANGDPKYKHTTNTPTGQQTKATGTVYCQDQITQAPNNDLSKCPPPVTDPAANGGNCSNVSQCDLIQKYINPFINFLAALVGVAVVISIIIGGIQYGSSAGDPAKVTAAKNRIRNAIIALVTFLFLYALLNFLIPGGLL